MSNSNNEFRAFNSISKPQLKRIESHTEIIHSEIKTIENNGGGSARCMIAEVFRKLYTLFDFTITKLK